MKEMPNRDVEQLAMVEAHLCNTTARNLSWRGITVTVKDRETKQPKAIVDNVEGYVAAGQCSEFYSCTNPPLPSSP